jgi:hypothetical protein
MPCSTVCDTSSSSSSTTAEGFGFFEGEGDAAAADPSGASRALRYSITATTFAGSSSNSEAYEATTSSGTPASEARLLKMCRRGRAGEKISVSASRETVSFAV